MSFSSYGDYKDTGLPELGAVPAHWDVSPLKHIVEDPITDGPHETPEFIADGIPFVSAEAVSTGEINFSKSRFISQADHDRYSKKYKPHRNDIFMVKSGATTGVVALVSTDQDFNIWSPLAVVRCSRLALPRYVLQAMRSRNFQESVRLNWNYGTQQNIGMSVLENLRIPLPPIVEQTQIARFLDYQTARIDALIEQQQRLIELLKEKRQALISNAVTKGLDPSVPMKNSGVEWLGKIPFNWTLPKLGHLARVINGSTPSRDNNEYWSNGDIPWVASGALNDYQINSASEFITKKALAECSVEIVPRGAVLVGLVGQGKTRGLAALLNIDATINQNVCAVIPNLQKVLSEFLHLYLHSLYEPMRDFGRGANQAALNCELVSALRIPLPTLEEQSKIIQFVAHRLSVFQTLEAHAQSSIALMQERRSALISSAVTGKIDVRGWQSPVSAPSRELEQEAV
ncbi:type I restriction enzyme S subunit [Pseudomonas sp. SJZ080]|uniref:restriction endonuclease subunit S n=1 Tax=Pseudomonas sp. SJZ080 TaxID=2572888 RepID=UPI0011994C7C|nr:restriction endonuclease subunit S [Pseudomonas sp. SJZ080]TWC50931.1 type I restriction enzyme S subunit [Pseudomonas sp. SJZ080]